MAPDGDVREVVVDGAARPYTLVVPANRHQAMPMPLVLNHHGLTQTAGEQRTLSGFDEIAEREGIVVAYPDAGDRSWDFDDVDLRYVEAVIEDVVDSVCVDTSRIYAIGMSMGGGFSSFLACRLPDRITAVASIAVLHHHDAPECTTPAPTPLVTVLGRADAIYSIDEGLTLPAATEDAPGPLSIESAAWVATNQCDSEPVESTPAEGVAQRTYACAEGNDFVVYIHEHGHIWPKAPIQSLDTNEVVWEFLSRHVSD